MRPYDRDFNEYNSSTIISFNWLIASWTQKAQNSEGALHLGRVTNDFTILQTSGEVMSLVEMTFDTCKKGSQKAAWIISLWEEW